VTVGGAEIETVDRRRLAQRMALVEQQVATDSPVTVLDVVRLGRLPHRGPLAPWSLADEEAVKTALMYVRLTAHRDQPWHSLSGGERQRVQIARALAQSPRELLLDEPTNHLDIRHQLELLGLISRLPLTVIVAIHDLNLAARFCEEVVLLHEGRLVAAGTPLAVLTAERISTVFGVKAIVEPSTTYDGFRISYF
jgi:iron complex transport system ATP-binding protein